MTRKLLMKEIRKQEKTLLKTYKAMRRNKHLRHSSGMNLMKEIFKETRSGYKTIGISKMRKSELEKYLDVLTGTKAQIGTYQKQVERYKQQKQRALARGMGEDLISFIENNADDFEKFINSKSFKDSIASYEYESDLWDLLRNAKEEEQSDVFKHWLEEKEDLWNFYGIDDSEKVFKYSDIVNEDNWKEVLKRLAEAW